MEVLLKVFQLSSTFVRVLMAFRICESKCAFSYFKKIPTGEYTTVVSLPSLVDFSSDHFYFECRKIFTKCRFLAGFSEMFPGLKVGVFSLKIAGCRASEKGHFWGS
jgi:hypothetical protein